MTKILELESFVNELTALGERPVEVSLESMQGTVDLIDPADLTDQVVEGTHSLLRQKTDEVFGGLTARQRQVLGLRFGLNDGKARSFAQVGREIGVSKSTAWRIERQALTVLRNPARQRRLVDYLG